MKGSELERGVRVHLLAHLPDAGYASRMLFLRPVGDLLRAVLFDSSGFRSDGCYVQGFVLPVVCPFDHLALNFALPDDRAWVAVTGPDDVQGWDNLKRLVISDYWPLLRAMRTLDQFVAHPPCSSEGLRNVPCALVMACATARLNRREDSERWLKVVADGLRDRPEWLPAYDPAAQRLSAALVSGGHAVQVLLDGWKSSFLESERLPTD